MFHDDCVARESAMLERPVHSRSEIIQCEISLRDPTLWRYLVCTCSLANPLQITKRTCTHKYRQSVGSRSEISLIAKRDRRIVAGNGVLIVVGIGVQSERLKRAVVRLRDRPRATQTATTATPAVSNQMHANDEADAS